MASDFVFQSLWNSCLGLTDQLSPVGYRLFSSDTIFLFDRIFVDNRIFVRSKLFIGNNIFVGTKIILAKRIFEDYNIHR